MQVFTEHSRALIGAPRLPFGRQVGILANGSCHARNGWKEKLAWIDSPLSPDLRLEAQGGSAQPRSMCGRYTLAKGKDEWAFAHIRIEWNGTPRYNIAPSQRAPIIRLEENLPVVRELRWGLVPSWAKDAKIGNSLVNARAETVAEKPSFRSAFKRRRCLVPADGFYEWQQLGKLKQPWRFVRPDDQPFVLAGLWESWRDPAEPGAEPLESFTVITTGPNAVAAPVHDRMPVILDYDGIRRWLDEETSPESLAALLRSCPDADLTLYSVAALVGIPKNDLAQCIAPLPVQLRLAGL